MVLERVFTEEWQNITKIFPNDFIPRYNFKIKQ